MCKVEPKPWKNAIELDAKFWKLVNLLKYLSAVLLVPLKEISKTSGKNVQTSVRVEVGFGSVSVNVPEVCKTKIVFFYIKI